MLIKLALFFPSFSLFIIGSLLKKGTKKKRSFYLNLNSIFMKCYPEHLFPVENWMKSSLLINVYKTPIKTSCQFHKPYQNICCIVTFITILLCVDISLIMNTYNFSCLLLKLNATLSSSLSILLALYCINIVTILL